MKAGIYRRRDNGKHIYVAKDRGIRAMEMTGVYPFSGADKVTTSEKERVVSFPQYTPDMQNLITVSADRVADVPNGTTDHVLALQHYIVCEAPMPAGVFKTPNDNLVYVDENHVIQATSLRPSNWPGMSCVPYYAGINAVKFCGYECTHYAEAIPDMTPQEQVDTLAQGMPQPGTTRAVTPMTMPTPQELRSDVWDHEPNTRRHALFSPATAARWVSCPNKPMTADEIREVFAKASHEVEKYRKVFPVSAAMRGLMVQEQNAVMRMHAQTQDLVAKGVISHVIGDEYMVVDIEALKKEIPEIALVLDSPPRSSLAAADFAELEKRVVALHPALGMPYGVTAGKRHGPFVPGRYMKDYGRLPEGEVAGVLSPAEFFVTPWPAVSDHGWYAEALAATRPRAVGKQSARKQRKKGRRVWWDAERNTRVWAPK